jgi:hypothetical protein
MKLIIILFLLVLILLRLNREKIYFFPIKLDKNYKEDYTEINIDNHHAIGHVTNNTKCLLISHGNYGNVYHGGSYIIDNLKNKYNGDIYCYEYQGFGKCKGSTSIKGCVDEHLFWLNYLAKKYDVIDLWGYSIGGGVLSQTIKKIPQSISYKINKLYYHNTFTRIKNVIGRIYYPTMILYSLFLLDDFNTIDSFSNTFFKNKKIIFLHSINDMVIPYSEAIRNHARCEELKYNTKLIQLKGDHIRYLIEHIE